MKINKVILPPDCSILRGRLTLALLTCLALSPLYAPAAETNSELRKFTDLQGRVIEARILSGTADTVTIEMADGNSHTVAVTKFSPADQTYILGWVKANPDKLPYKFEMTETAQRLGKDRRESASYKVTEESWIYELGIKNRSGFAIDLLDLRYRIFSSVPNTSDAGGPPTVTTADGKGELASFANNADVKWKTKTVILVESRLVNGSESTDGSDVETKQGLDGIWIKLFHKGAKVGEFQLGNDIVKKAEWPDEMALAIEGDITDGAGSP